MFQFFFKVRKVFEFFWQDTRTIKNQTIFILKNIQSKSCRAAEEFCGFSIERRAGRGSIDGGCCVAGGVIVSKKFSSSSIVMGFSADHFFSSRGKRNLSTGWAIYLESGVSWLFIPTYSATYSIICISPSWFSVMGTCIIWCSLKSLRIFSTMCQTWIGMSISARKTPETVSRPWICTRSGENSTEYMRLLFRTEKINLSNKVRTRVKTRKI